jgi:hypothetical protein
VKGANVGVLACFPYASVQFTKEGDLFLASEREAVLQQAADGVTDVLVLAHGWNNDMVEAHDLYARLATHLCAQQSTEPGAARRVAVVGVLWPSKRFTEPSAVPGGGASLSAPGHDLDAFVDDVRAQLADTMSTHEVEEITDLLRDVDDRRSARDRLVEMVLDQLRQVDLEPEEVPDGFLDPPREDVLLALAVRPPVAELGGLPRRDPTADTGTALGMFTGKGRAGAANLLNVFTYYTMRHRAGVVGARGLNDLLRDLRARFPTTRLHLVGHSFGARLVTAAVQGDGHAVPVDSLCLVQAAFSQHAFAGDFRSQPGHFRPIVERGLVAGPIVVTHTRNDRAVAIAYALASRFRGQVTSFIGERGDPFGGLGANGAHPGSTPEADDTTVPLDWSTVPLTPGRINNLEADAVIDSHSGITNAAVARAVWAAVAGAP